MTTPTVVICAYDDARWDQLQGAVDSVVAQSTPPPEVVVVIDHNPGLFGRALAAWDGHPVVRVIANAGPAGLSGARNEGVGAASGAIVAFLDDDAVAVPGWLDRLLGPFDDAEVVAAGGAVRPSVRGTVPDWWPHEFDWVIGCSWTGLPRGRADVRNVIGCNMAFRRAALVGVGGFSTDTGRVRGRPAGCEETDLCIRLRSAESGARRVVYVPDALVDHRVPQERLSWTYFRRRCFWEGMSKAVVARRNGPDVALSSERAYVSHTLPAGVVRGLVDAGHGSHGSLRRSSAIVAGLALTTAGYACGRIGGSRD